MVESATALTVAFLPNIGTTELLIILVVVLILFGAEEASRAGEGMGKSIKEFKKATSEIEDEVRTAIEATEPDFQRSITGFLPSPEGTDHRGKFPKGACRTKDNRILGFSLLFLQLSQKVD